MVSDTGNRWFGTRWHLSFGAGWLVNALRARRQEP
jgi:hypothetical protein